MHGNRLHGPEFFIMERIRTSPEPDNGVPVSDLGVGASKPAVSQMLNNLERKGYIERSIAPGDRRKIIVRLTREGETALLEAKSHLDKSLDALIELLGEDDYRELLRLMSRLMDIIEEIGG